MQLNANSDSELLFEYSWAIVREVDRINRQSQAGISLHKRIHKLRAMAEPFLYDRDGKPKSEYVGWLQAWEDTTEFEEGEMELPAQVRWEQFRLLIRLFHQEGVFTQRGISYGRINFMERNNE